MKSAAPSVKTGGDPAWQGRVAVVTGASSGLGLALAAALAERGALPVLVARDATRLRQALATLGGRGECHALDVRDADGLRSLARDLAQRHGRLDLWFNNAGLTLAGEFQQMRAEHLQRMLEVDLLGVLNGCSAAYALMHEQGRGHIVNIASLAGLLPTPGLAGYAMCKHGVVGLSLSLRLEAAQRGVRVSVACPAAVDTPADPTRAPADLPPLPEAPWLRRFLDAAAGRPAPAAEVAQAILRGTARNDALILPGKSRAVAWLYRMAPGLVWRDSQGRVAAARGRDAQSMK